MQHFPPAFFVTGTDTGVGKTVISAMLVKGLNALYWKPVQSGLEDGMSDTDRVKKWTELPESHFYPEKYKLSNPLSPHASALIDNVEIRMEAFKLPRFSKNKKLVVEGAGGIMVPLNDSSLMLTLMKQLHLPVVLVSRSELGTINHTLLSIEQLRRYDIPIWGVIMNGEQNDSNRKAIEHYGDVEVKACVQPLAEISPVELDLEFRRLFSR